MGGNVEGGLQAMERMAEQSERARQIIQRLEDFAAARDAAARGEPGADHRGGQRVAMGGVGSCVGLETDIAADAVEAFIDKVQIQQVLLNLMRTPSRRWWAWSGARSP